MKVEGAGRDEDGIGIRVTRNKRIEKDGSGSDRGQGKQRISAGVVSPAQTPKLFYHG